MTNQQLHLNRLLRQASEGLLTNDCEISIPLYKTALHLINDDPYSYDLSDLDVCVIEYSLYKCYSVNEKCFSEAIEDYICLVVKQGRRFPFLYYGLATMCLNQHSYRQAESVISNGLDAVASVKIEHSFKANWPGTNVEIPETNPEYLVRELRHLKQQCCSMQEPVLVEEDEIEGAHSDGCYMSDSSSSYGDNENGFVIPLKTELPKAGSGSPSLSPDLDSGLSNEPQLVYPAGTSSLDEVDQVDDITMTEVMNRNDAEESVKPKSYLKVDVPEFVPRAIRSNSINNNTIVTTLANPAVVSPLSESEIFYPALSELHKFSQTVDVQVVNKNTQMTVKSVNASTQTQNLEGEEGKENLQHVPCMKQITDLTAEISKLTKEVQQKNEQIQSLQASMLSQQEIAMKAERQHLVHEQKSNIELLRLEVRVEGLKEFVHKLEVRNEEQHKKIQMLQALLTECYNRSHAREKQLLVNHTHKCSAMISSLNSVVRYLSPMSFPTLEECQRQFCQWEDELESTRTALKSFNCFWQRVSADMRMGIFSAFPEPPDLPIRLVEMRDILHDNYMAVVQTLVKEQQLRQQQKQNYQPYSMVYTNYGRIVKGVPIQSASYFHNQHQSLDTYRAENVQHPNNFEDNTMTITTPVVHNEPTEKLASSTYEDSCIVSEVDTASINSKNSPLDDSKAQELKTELEQEDKSDHKSGFSFLIQKSCTSVDSNVHSKQICRIPSSRPTETSVLLTNSLAAASDQDKQFAITELETLTDSVPEESKETLNDLQTAIKAMKIDWVKTLESDNKLLQPIFVENEQGDSTDKQTAHLAEEAPSSVADDNVEGKFTNLNQLLKKPPESSLGVQPKGRSNFQNLVAYVASNIPGTREEEVACIIKSVRRSVGKLSGMTRDRIIDIVRTELNGDANRTENKPALKLGKLDVPPSDKNNADTKCVICIEPYGSTAVITLLCKHKFHAKCIKKWLGNNSMCPVCRIHAVWDEDSLY